MKLTKKLEAEILKAYHEYWDAYLKGDMQAMSYWLHDDVQMIGSGRGEFFKNKKQTLKYYKSTAAQVAGKADMRNRKINVTTVGNQILVSEECDFFVLIDSVWTFYEQGRISTLFVKTNKGWKIIEEHGSMPDARTAEGEQVNTDKIKAENIRLKDAVKRRTIELEEKNHELKIETSLEKVRAVAMGMTRPDDLLHICQSLFNELRRLRFTEIRNAIINTFENKKPFFLDYDYSDLLGGTITKIPINANTIIKNHLKRIKKGSEAFSETIVTESEIKKWVVDRRKRGEPEDPRLKKLKLLCYYFYSIGPAAIGISTYRKIGEEKLEILKRFRNVFKLSYQRYIDIAKAEAQAQEAQLESALERVRAVVMAMHTPGDLSVIGKTIYQQLKSLGFSGIRNTEIIINNDNKERIKTYHYSDYGKEEIIEINYKENPIVKKWANDLRKADNAFVPVSIPKREIKKWNQYRKKIGYKNDPKMSKANAVYYYSYSIGLGALSVSSWQQLHEEQIKTLERFRNVFNLSYKRYIDIAKAEAQAREAEIELALERVRARSLAMHKTSELQEVIHVVHKELLHLNLSIDGGSFVVINADVDPELRCWGSGGTADTSEEILIPHFNMPFCTNLIKGIKKRQGFFTEEFSQKEKKEYFTKLFKQKPWSQVSSKQKKETLSSPGGYTRSVAVSKHTSIAIINHQGIKFTEAENNILKRFAKVFEQTYTRFLDLQKAEAQAREAQIEASLERVRSRAMAMHTSDELKEVAKEMRNQLHLLGQKELETCAIHLWDEPTGQFEAWAALRSPDNTGKIIESESTFKIKGIKILEENFQHYRDGKKDYVLINDVAKARQFFEALKPVDPKAYAFLSPTIKNKKPRDISAYWAVADFAGGSLVMVTMNPPEENSRALLRRFANVFGLAYRRFSDLQKAEAQTREAQIQLALERVRARTMAMQKSDELKETTLVLFQQFKSLGATTAQVSICLFDDEAVNGEMFLTLKGEKIDRSFKMELYKETFIMQKVAKAFLAKQKEISITVKGKKLQEYNRWRNNKVGKKSWDESNAVLKKAWHVNAVFFSGGMMGISSGTHPSEEALKLLERFAKVFDQTYTRFLDLQKAEAQAKEAQIEVALEKVRSRTMAMQKSEELKDVINLVYEQLIHLNIHVEHAGFLIDYKTRDDLHIWLADEHLAPSEVIFPWFDCPPNNAIRDAKDKGEDFFFYHLNFKEKNKFYRDLFKLIPGIPEETIDYYLHCKGLAGSGVLLESIGLYIENFSGTPYTDEENAVLMRFGKVFQQTYTRFLDLQKAEAQANEAKIEAALERIRSMVTAMHESNELLDIVVKMRTEFVALGHEAHYFWHMKWTAGKYLKAMTSGDGSRIGMVMELPRKIHAEIKQIADWEKGREPVVVYVMDLNATLDYVHKMETWGDFERVDPNMPTEEDLHHIGGLTFIMARTQHGEIGYSLPGMVPHPPQEAINTLIRFAAVFDLAYRRFEDLKTAEKQNRETQIELALERVRARTMAMQKSDELNPTADLLFEQLRLLGAELQGVAFAICDKDSDLVQKWTSIGVFSFSSSIEPAEQNMYEAWKNKIPLYEEVFEGERIKKYYETLMEVPAFKQGLQQLLDAGIPMPAWQKNHAVSFQQGYLLIITTKPFAEPQIFIRFGKVFEQTYTRFLDLQKAEAQAREAEIQLALERVRAKTMAMQKQNELSEVLDLLVENLVKLGVQLDVANFSNGLPEGDWDLWISGPTGDGTKFTTHYVHIPRIDHPYFLRSENDMANYKSGGNDLTKQSFTKEEKDSFQDYLFSQTTYKDVVSDEGKQYLYSKPGYIWSAILLKNTWVSIGKYDTIPFNDEEDSLLRRFANAFGLAYTRFLDLQKAEVQAREAQIEAALERVRSRSMAMHKSEELLEVINVVSNQLQQLDIRFGFVCFGIIHPQGNLDFWMAAPGIGQPEKIHMPFVNNPITNSLIEAHKKGTRVLKDIFPKEAMLEWSKVFFENNPDSQIMAQSKEYIQESPGLVRTSVILKEIDVFAGKFADKPFTDEQNEIIVRFANVFEQSYIRFLDLQKAEMQAREAKIEVSLEKVRTVALILKKSDEMLDVVQALYEALYDLGFTNIRNSIIDVHNPQKETFLDYDYSPQMGRSITEMSYYDSPFIENQVRKTEADNDAFFELILEGQELQDLIDMRLKNGEAEDIRLRQTKQLTYNLYSFGNGAIGISNFGLLSDEQKEILKRFRNVFAFAYKRYSDMVQAEALAREAQIEAALEKVRSRTLAMQKSDELAETAAVLFQQLITLGIAPNRLFIIIMKADSADLEAWVTDEDGSKVSIGFTTNYQNNSSIKKMYEGWQQQKKSLVIDMQGEELQQYFHYLHDELKVPFKGGLEQKRRIQHLAYFSHGLIGMASPEEQPAETIQLLERFAAVFNLTFTRFNDLKIAEAHAIQAEQDLIAIKEAKQKAEEALTELQSTQKQLIQSEKMASLGELTAGIAHEIQNPLNFVNNFSEVSKELLDEMKEAIEKGDTEDAKQIMNDVIQNLEKINHHGKRADGIVKGMLQHSRSSTGQKELTDINALCDEYLRLSYHGLRAKDKTFNAKFETSFDESIGKVNIVPQEIGRVILNLINNAFYAVGERSKAEGPDQRIGAVSEKKKTADKNYEPTVIVSTKKENETVLISVKDNGNGIPENIKDKIFQPFFTTKPTGQGTGLGLSLSYDIVKAHGGELKVETKEGEGSAFILLLPG